MAIGAPNKDVLKFECWRYTGELTVIFDVGVCVMSRGVRRRAVESGFIGKTMHWVGGKSRDGTLRNANVYRKWLGQDSINSAADDSLTEGTWCSLKSKWENPNMNSFARSLCHTQRRTTEMLSETKCPSLSLSSDFDQECGMSASRSSAEWWDRKS